MIKSAVTISLVNEARGGPFVFWDDLAEGCSAAAELGFDAIEVFAPSAEAVDAGLLQKLLSDHGLSLAAVGTGAGWLIHQWHLCDPSPFMRDEAKRFIRSMIDFGGHFKAPAIIGSMQGRWTQRDGRQKCVGYLTEALAELGEHAAQHQVPLIYEPLNRYETNLVNTIADGVSLLEIIRGSGVKLLADLFHMNIEEANLPAALRAGGSHIGHIHFVDSNRRAAGAGHTDFGPIAAAIRDIGYQGYLSVEAFPFPDSRTAAKMTIDAFEKHFLAT